MKQWCYSQDLVVDVAAQHSQYFFSSRGENVGRSGYVRGTKVAKGCLHPVCATAGIRGWIRIMAAGTRLILSGCHVVYRDGIQNLREDRNKRLCEKNVYSLFQLMSVWDLTLTLVLYVGILTLKSYRKWSAGFTDAWRYSRFHQGSLGLEDTSPKATLLWCVLALLSLLVSCFLGQLALPVALMKQFQFLLF